jgi:hypothetical protein
MKKFKKISVLSLLVASALFVGCNKEDGTGVSTLVPTSNVKGTIALPFTAVQNVNEIDEDSFTFSVTLSAPQVVPIHVAVTQISGSAVAGKDYEVTDIMIPAYATTASGTVTIINDSDIESMEDFALQIGDITTANASIDPKTLSFTINNNYSTKLDLSFKFDKPFSVSGTALTLCGIGYNMDYYLLDSSLNDTGDYSAATNACNEKISLDSATLADGTYYIYYDVLDDGGISNAYHDPFDVTTAVSYSRIGGINPGVFNQEIAFAPNTTDGSGSDYVVTVELNAGIFTIKNSIPDVIATGRTASFKNKIKAAISAARANNHK